MSFSLSPKLCYRAPMLVDVVIPALNEEASLPKVLADLRDPRIRTVFVADNGSTDRTAAVARAAGAVVVSAPQRGYGAACLEALAAIRRNPPDTVLFVDGDYSDFPEEASLLLDAIEQGADLVIGSRNLGGAERGALMPVARFGNWLSTRLIDRFWGVTFTDLGPFRAIRWQALEQLEMVDRDFGWTVEMQVRAAARGLVCREVGVRYRARIGQSKVSGTVRGSYRAGKKILYVIAREKLSEML
jgi:glycosyltransferase involved in cell wall biosynthesis